jgi:hypothetical protein
MKRTRKIALGSVLVLAALVSIWCLLCPVLFPHRMKAANDSYNKWIAEQPSAKK